MRTYPVMPGVPAMGHVTSGGNWHPGRADNCGKCETPRSFVLKRSDIQRCPKHSLSPRHYNEDGTCKCPKEEP